MDSFIENQFLEFNKWYLESVPALATEQHATALQLQQPTQHVQEIVPKVEPTVQPTVQPTIQQPTVQFTPTVPTTIQQPA